MGNLLRTVLGLGAAGLLSFGAMPVFAAESDTPPLSPNSLGIWRTDDGTMDYEMTLCGDGTQLCGQLVTLHGKGDNRRNRKYLGQYILKELKATKENVWKGTVTLQDNTADGTVTIVPGNTLTIHGCAYIVVCADIKLNPVPGPVAAAQ